MDLSKTRPLGTPRRDLPCGATAMRIPAWVAAMTAGALMVAACAGDRGDQAHAADGQTEAGDQAGAGGERAGAGAGLGVSPNRGFVSFSADAYCGFRGDATMDCWWPLSESVESEVFVAIDGIRRRPQCGIRVNGTLRCWGRYGIELDVTVRYEEFPFGEQRFTALSAGSLMCAIRVDRTVACTDYGYPMSRSPDSPDRESDREFVAVSAGRPHMCGVRVGGALACWRHPNHDDPSPVLSPPSGRFTSVSVRSSHACAVRVDGGVVCWGDDWDGETSPPPGRFVDVAVSPSFSCGLRSDGEVVCWGLRRSSVPDYPAGWNKYGGLWPRGPFTALDVNNQTEEICALRVSGEVACWNNGTATHEPPGGVFVALDAGPYSTCGLRPDGEVVCWGWGRGLDYPRSQRLPVAWDVPSGPFTAISVGRDYACGLRPDGEAACWGHGKLRAERHDVSETPDERENRRRLEPPPGPFTALSAGDEFTCGLRPDGEVACWGMSDTDSGRELSEPPPGPFSAVRAGYKHACGLRPDGRVTCWRSSTSWHSYVYLNERFGEQTTLDGTWTALTGGHELACGLRPGGEFACADADNVLSRHAPDVVFRAVASTGRACGLDHRGEITCWSHRGHREPAPPGPFTAVTAGTLYTCGLRPDGTAECWTTHWPPTADPAAAAS